MNQARSVLEFFLLSHDERVLVVFFHCCLDLIKFSDRVVDLPNVTQLLFADVDDLGRALWVIDIFEDACELTLVGTVLHLLSRCFSRQ